MMSSEVGAFLILIIGAFLGWQLKRTTSGYSDYKKSQGKVNDINEKAKDEVTDLSLESLVDKSNDLYKSSGGDTDNS